MNAAKIELKALAGANRSRVGSIRVQPEPFCFRLRALAAVHGRFLPRGRSYLRNPRS